MCVRVCAPLLSRVSCPCACSIAQLCFLHMCACSIAQPCFLPVCVLRCSAVFLARVRAPLLSCVRLLLHPMTVACLTLARLL